MKKLFAGILLISGLCLLCWAQAAKEPFDVKKSQAELEIMRGILSTTAKYVAQNYQKRSAGWAFSNIRAYYLAGQGAVFTIPTSGFQPFSPIILSGDSVFASPDVDTEAVARQLEESSRMTDEYMRDYEENMREYEQSMREYEKNWNAYQEALRKAGNASKSNIAPPVPPAPPAPDAAVAPPAPAAPPAPPPINREELRKRVDRIQTNIKKSREEAEANREKLRRGLEEIKIHLIEALANYGDSITTVKPAEYINLIFLRDNAGREYGELGTRQDVLSVQKSWIMEYKAGKLTMDAFKQKVLQYEE